MKRLKIEKFIDSGFDMLVFFRHPDLYRIVHNFTIESIPAGASDIIPRLNHPTVLDDYRVLPDGLIIKYKGFFEHAVSGQCSSYFCEIECNSSEFKESHINSCDLRDISWVSILGLQEGYEHEGMQVYQ